jgi:hypothetical protein
MSIVDVFVALMVVSFFAAIVLACSVEIRKYIDDPEAYAESYANSRS